MTETSYQTGRKFMQQVNHVRGLITKAEGNVAKWTKIEDSHRENLRHEQADGANKCLQRAMIQLNELRDRFKNMKFPDSDIVINKSENVQCENCGNLIAIGNTYCNECLSQEC